MADIALGFSSGYIGIALNTGNIGPAMFAMYSFLSRTSLMVNDTTSSPILLMSPAQVAAHAVTHHLRLLHNLFNRKLADDAAKMAFHHQTNQSFALRRRFGKKLLGARANGNIV